LDHVNAHKHFHLHPTIAELILKIGQGYGLVAMRVPLEPARLIAALEPGTGHPASVLVAPWAAPLRRRLSRQGLVVPDQILGLAWSGAMTAKRVASLLRQLPAGSTEIYLHPATAGDIEGAAAGYRYVEELQALTDPAVRAAVEASGARLCGFRDLVTVPSPIVS
jgi:predicted glycoside hydrolase/deacetylase ChbG (UPF0249 family)